MTSPYKEALDALGALSSLLRNKISTADDNWMNDIETIRQSLTDRPVRTTAEAIERIADLTGLRRGLTQTRTFLAGLGFTWQRTRAVPVPPKSR